MSVLYGFDARNELILSMPDWQSRDLTYNNKVCHVNCPAGTDTKNRMYVKKVASAVLWHCHNCGNSGHFTTSDLPNIIDGSTACTLGPTSLEVIMDNYNSCEQDHDKFSVEAKLWLGQYNMLNTDYKTYPIKFRGYVNRVVLPVVDMLGNMRGYQERRCAITTDDEPKYVTAVDGSYAGAASYYLQPRSELLVITEDILSAMKVYAAGYSSAAMLSTSNKLEVPPGITHCIIWLDEDTAGTKGAMKMYTDINPLFEKCVTYCNWEPKKNSLGHIQRICDAFLGE